jgi:hypothetical protein
MSADHVPAPDVELMEPGTTRSIIGDGYGLELVGSVEDRAEFIRTQLAPWQKAIVVRAFIRAFGPGRA